MTDVFYPAQMRYFFRIYLCSLVCFAFFRVYLAQITWSYAQGMPEKGTYLFKSVLMGIRFDTVVSCFVMLIPALLFTVFNYLKFKNKAVIKTIHYLMMLGFCLALFMCASDIQFFSVFFSRLNAVILDWADTSGITMKVLGTQWPYLIVYTAVLTFLFYLTNKELNVYLKKIEVETPKNIQTLGFSLSLILLISMGLNGRFLGKEPFDSRAANFTEYAFPNQISLNPATTFTNSFISLRADKDVYKFKLMNEDTALNFVRRELGLEGKEWLKGSPIAREIKFETPPQYQNVILVLMESMSAHYLSRFRQLPEEDGKYLSLTPYLDSLSDNSVFFDNFYSAGVHTSNGIYASLCGYPIVPGAHPMQRRPIEKYDNLPMVLKENGYSTTFFYTHDLRFDNMNEFLEINGFDKLYAEQDHPKEDIVNMWGVSDRKLFEFAIPKLNEMAATNKPFFSTLLTVSHHAPFDIPSDAKMNFKSSKPENQIVEYSDKAIQEFMSAAKKQPWFEKTVFVFVADHGCMTGPNFYDMPLSMNHVPLFIYAPKLLENKLMKQPGGQIDIAETVLGILKIPHINNSFGVDLLRGQRQYMFFQNDSKVGAVDSTHFFLHRLSAHDEAMFKYRNHDLENVVEKEANQRAIMRKVAISAPQMSQWMIKNKKTSLK